MDIKVEEYVRTKRGIAKVLEVKIVQPKMHGKHDTAYLIDKCPRMYITETEFIKHSFNLTDLIEVEDIVEYQVNSLSAIKVGKVKKYRDARSNSEYLGVEGFDITKIYILSVLTHEQFEANCYKVKGEENVKNN